MWLNINDFEEKTNLSVRLVKSEEFVFVPNNINQLPLCAPMFTEEGFPVIQRSPSNTTYDYIRDILFASNKSRVYNYNIKYFHRLRNNDHNEIIVGPHFIFDCLNKTVLFSINTKPEILFHEEKVHSGNTSMYVHHTLREFSAGLERKLRLEWYPSYMGDVISTYYTNNYALGEPIFPKLSGKKELNSILSEIL